MRIIAGSARGTPICAPCGQDTRPTQDKVKESLFSMVQTAVPDAVVLDLFAGSGALGLEAVSRGAEHAVLVEPNGKAVACIRANIAKLRFDASVTLHACGWEQALVQLKRDGLRFHLVFIDPPYRMLALYESCGALADAGLLAPEATLVLEHHAGELAAPDARFVCVKERRYGDTELHIYHYQGEESL
ncbi:MAG: 16S rRNA (guanine(966)-N(2))-methyltransferase RsmD [Clostridia bacterium]